MRIIFFGSDEFGIPCLEELKRNYKIVGIVTSPDKPKGRGMKLSPTPVKEWAIRNNIDVYQPSKLEGEFCEFLKGKEIDLLILISYGKILPKEILKIPKFAPLNLHPSLLPKYRGAAPIEWALINGEKETGITVIKMDEKIDEGEIVVQRKVEIKRTDDIFTLKKRLMEISPSVLLEGISAIKEGKPTKPQKGTPSFARKLKKEDGLIKWEKSAEEIYNLVRGIAEWPTAYTFLPTKKGKKYLRIFSVEVSEGKGKPGEVINTGKDFIEVACGKGSIKLKRVQMEGKKILDVEEFLRGTRIEKGTILGNG